jgi:hypothetical protein
MQYVYLCIAVAGTFLLTYLVIGREMNMVLLVAGMVLILLICFFSVKLSLILLILSMLLSPEIVVGETTKRAVTARIEDVLLLTMTLGWMLRMAIFKDIGFMLKTPLNRPIIVYSCIAILSTTLGVLRGNVGPAPGFFFTLKIIEYFFLFNVVINFVQDEKEIESMLTLLLCVCGVICLYGLSVAVSGQGDRISAPFEARGERNTLSGYLVLMGSVAAGVLMNTKAKLERTLIAILLAILVVVLLFSISRSGWTASIVSIFVLFACAKRKNVYFLVLALLLFTLPLFLPGVVHERINFTIHQVSFSEEQFEIFGIKLDTSSSARIFAAMDVLKYFTNHPFLGHGLTGFYFFDGQFFRVLIELGVLGLAAFVWLLTGVHNAIRRTMAIDLPPRLRGMVFGFYAGFWALISHAFTANTFIIVRISEPFWCLAGLTVILLSIRGPEAGTMKSLENRQAAAA